MTIGNAILIEVAATSALCLIIGVAVGGKNTSISEYFLMGGKLKPVGFVGTMLSTNLSLGNFILIAAIWGYSFGWSGMIWWTVNLVVNAFAYYYALPKFKSFIEDRDNSGSVHEYVATSFVGKGKTPDTSSTSRRKLRIWASVATSVCLLLATTFELHLAAQILAALTGGPIVVLYSVGVFSIVVYTAWGGFRSVVATDLVQGALVLAATVAAIVVIGEYSGFGYAPAGLPRLTAASSLDVGWANIVSIVVVATGWFWVTMDTWQRSCASRSASTSALGFGWYTAGIICYGLVFSYIGIFDANVLRPALGPDAIALHSAGANPFLDLFLIEGAKGTGVGIALLATIAVGLWMASMSTADTFLTVATSSLMQDTLLVRPTVSGADPGEQRRQAALVGLSKALMLGLGVGLLLIWVALYVSEVLVDVSSFFFVVYGVQFALLAPISLTFLPAARRPSCESVTSAIKVGVTVALTVGFGSWAYMRLSGDSSILGIKGSEWMTLTPVITTISGFVMLLPRLRRLGR